MRREWTTVEEKKLRELFPVYKTQDVANMMGRSYGSIKDRARALKLKKLFDFSDKWLPGQKPKHAVKGWCAKGCEKTWFSKDNKGHCFPLGSEIFRKGCVFVKVSDGLVEGSGHKKFSVWWKRKKHIVWEENFGPIPANKFVVMKDKNPHNCAPENLTLAGQKELYKYATPNWDKFRASRKRLRAERQAAAEARV